MTVLIIGGAGFIGFHLTEHLLSEKCQVRVLSRKPNPFYALNPKVDYIFGDYLNESLLKTALQGVDVVYQLVSTTTPSTSNLNIVFDVESNVVGMVRLLELCVEASIRKVIFPSSGGTIYGIPEEVPIHESHPTDPICSYAIAKLTVEKYLRLFHHLYKLDYTILRIANPYGPGQDPSGKIGVIPRFLSQIQANEPIKIWGDGTIVRDYIYVLDVVKALYNAMQLVSEEKVFNIGSGRGTSLNELINIIKQVTGSTFAVEYVQGRLFDTPVSVL
ncbi:MAG TPA: NAD-dependent epimerase/dehydratase family protein, partial [Phormidium sp.]